MSNTDDAWEKFGKTDPYYGVLKHASAFGCLHSLRIRVLNSFYLAKSTLNCFLKRSANMSTLTFRPNSHWILAVGLGELPFRLHAGSPKLSQPTFLKPCFPRRQRIA